MSATVNHEPAGPKSSKLPPKIRLTQVDREFLPAALELLETPPSPVRMWLLLSLCAMVATAVLWAFIGRIDIIAVAQGKIQSVGRVKFVQPIEAGKVRSLLARNGQHVTEGDAVVKLDDSEAAAEEAGLAATVASFRAEAIRRKASIEGAKSRVFAPAAPAWPDGVPVNIREREERVLRGDLQQLATTLASFQAQRRQKEAESARLTASIASQEKLLTIEGERVELRSTLEQQKLGSKLNRLDAEEALQQQRTTLTQQKGQLAEAAAAIEVLTQDAAKTADTFIADNSQKLAEAERQLEDNVQRLAKARSRTEHMVLRAPVSGVVQGLTIISSGQVVMAGDEVMRIVPEIGGGYEIECFLPNKDIGFVSEGQDAIVKIESYPFTRYGVLNARVSRIGIDAIPEPEAAQREADPAKAPKSTFLGGAERTQNLYFPVILTPEQQNVGHDTSLPISNGMGVTVEIKTGDRRIIDYLFSPLVEVGARALKER